MSSRPVLLAALLVAAAGLFALVRTLGTGAEGDVLAVRPRADAVALGRDAERAALVTTKDPAVIGDGIDSPRRTGAASAELGDAGEEPGEPWRVRITTMRYEGRGRQGVPTGNLGVRLGTGFPDPAAEVLAEGRTGADGACEVELSPEVVAALEGERPIAWVFEDGWQFRPRSFELTEEPPADPIGVMLVAVEGRSLPGRLFDPEGEPTPGRIQLYEPRPEGVVRQRNNTTANEDGWFALDFAQEGRFHLAAESELGTAVQRDVVLDLRSDPEPIELHLVGPGRLRGVVRDGTGEPAPGLSLLLRVAELDDGAGGWALIEPRASDLRLEGRGLLQTYETTDESGSFDAEGLRAGDWVIRTREASSRAFSVVLTPGPVVADGKPLELSLRRPHLRVRLLGLPDSTGSDSERKRTWVGAPSPFSNRREAWPARPRLVVHPLEASARLDATPRSLPTRFVAEGEYVVEVEEDTTYVVGAFGGEHPWVERTVHVPPGAGRIEVELPMPAGRGLGGLLLSVVDASGEPRTNRMSLQVYDAESDAPVVGYDDFRGVEWPLRLELPAGRYRLVVRDQGSGRRWDAGGGRTAGLFDTLVDVLPGTDVPLVAALPEGARIRLTLSGKPNEADSAGARERLGERGARWAEMVARSVQVVLVDDQGQVAQNVAFEREGGRTDSRVPFDYEGLSGVLYAGRFVLEARTEGGRVTSVTVQLVDGQTTEVALSFED